MATDTAVQHNIATGDIQLNPAQQKVVKDFRSSFKFKLFTLAKLPLGFISGMRIKYLDAHRCEATIPYGWITRNPFKSTYFAALSMAAELSNGSLALLATYGQDPSVAVIITGVQAEFLKKATDLVTFTCEDGDLLFQAVERAKETGEGVEQEVIAIGTMPDGTEVARFKFTWSFKARSKKA